MTNPFHSLPFPAMKHQTPDKDSLEMGQKIASFFHIKHNLDYSKSNDEILKLKIVLIQDYPDKVVIGLSRPGLLIGAKGKQIEALQTFLNKPIEIKESFIWEDVMMGFDYNPVDYL